MVVLELLTALAFVLAVVSTFSKLAGAQEAPNYLPKYRVPKRKTR
jgi:hypothetical protein